jgi:hypothetical protein
VENLLFERSIKSLYENGKLSFKDLKETLSKTSNFILEKQDLPKGKKVLLSYNINEGKLLIANNPSEIKQGYKKINEYIKTCENLKEEIYYSLNNLEKNISSMNQEDQENIFGPDNNIFYKIEIVLKPDNAFNYNTKHFNVLPDGHGEYDKSGKMIVKEVTIQVNKFNDLLTEWQNKLKYENYTNEVAAIRKLREHENQEYYNYAVNKIDNSLSNTNSYIGNSKFVLGDDSTIDDYILSRVYILLNALLEKSNTGSYNPLSKMNIAKRVLGIKGIGSQDIYNKLEVPQREYIRNNILNDFSKKEILKNAIKPIEEIIINYSINLLKTIQAYMLLTNNTSFNRLNKQINNSINYINTSNSFLGLKNELKNLKHLDKYTNNKEFSFYYDGEVYKPSGFYKPINELLNVFKPFTESSLEKKVIDENNIEKIINETITKRGNKYCLLSKKTKRNLGCYNSKQAVRNREKQINYFKSVKEMSTAGGASSAAQGYAVKKQDLES